jgi:hypothetical protein
MSIRREDCDVWKTKGAVRLESESARFDKIVGQMPCASMSESSEMKSGNITSIVDIAMKVHRETKGGIHEKNEGEWE